MRKILMTLTCGRVFDLQGRPLSGPSDEGRLQGKNPTRRGLYIQGNKKVFIR